ncbi:hypothetical protein COO59_00115 [Mixta theicola]|uniref:Lysozyme n=1 Tax=Mixta theicola TaxID=1458355 RepID=A0A2K1QF80_9GAMM|nr:hypothetical protein COO59_00115 [Mixta theicola]
MKKSGIKKEKAAAIANGARIKGCSAYNFFIMNRDLIGEITEQQQLNLFILTYDEIKKDVERICKDDFTIKKYHPDPNISASLAWNNIPGKIKEVLVDLRYWGDYNPKSRVCLQRMAYAGDLKGFGSVIADRSIWPSVPNDRFKRRVDFYESN